jgi:hypothetical protein
MIQVLKAKTHAEDEAMSGGLVHQKQRYPEVNGVGPELVAANLKPLGTVSVVGEGLSGQSCLVGLRFSSLRH